MIKSIPLCEVVSKMVHRENIELNTCPILFIIGNGFDLGLGMKTRYEDVYDGYIHTSPKSQAIEAFKAELSKRKPYDKWSDFEMGMAEYARTISTEDEFIACIRDFKSYMVEHLSTENKRIIELIRDKAYENDLTKELDRSREAFFEGLTPNVKNQIRAIIGNAIPTYNYITFNYTSVLEELLALKSRRLKLFENAPLHIHGSLDNDVVLGVDNPIQLNGAKFFLSSKIGRAFIKTAFNEQYDRERVAAAKRLINESAIICTYGFSMGKSDQTWVDMLKGWLLESKNHHLVAYQYDSTSYNRCNFDEMMDIEDIKKTNLLKRLGIDQTDILDQIHIPIGYNIFNFKFVKVVGATTANPPYNIHY